MNGRADRNAKIFPWVSLGLLLFTFGLLTPWLGFYFDDWPVIANLHLRDSASTFWDFHRSDRPVAAWTYGLVGRLLGERPMVWQFFSIFVRWLAVLGVWWIGRGLWPSRKTETAWIALLFAIFPAFDQQAISVAYSQHWMVFALFGVSMGAMLQAERDPRRFWSWTALALGANLTHVFSMEYFAGLEFLRPLFLLQVAAETRPLRKEQFKYALKRWLPYLAILAIFVAWRLLIYPQTRSDPNHPEVLFGLFSQPLSAILTLVQHAVQDFLNILIGSWYKTLDPAAYLLDDRIVQVSLVMAGIAGAVIYFYLQRSSPSTPIEESDPSSSTWSRHAFWLGLLGVLFGVLPVWLTGRETTLGLYGSRFALASMFGASMLTVAIVVEITPRRTTRIVLLTILVSLAVGFHVRRVEIFQRSWVKQERFYWQLFWRAPELRTGASIAADGELFLYVGRYSTALTLNIVYPEALPYPEIGHYFYELPERIEQRAAGLVAGEPVKWGFRNFSFSGSTRDTVLVAYEPELGNCLWVIDPQDKDNPDLSELAKAGVGISNLNMIEPEAAPENGPPLDIFGPEPQHTWCYYFQKADLARQFGDWQTAAGLGDKAQAAGFAPNNPQEWLPFIEAYAHAGRWEEAIDKTLQVRRINFRVSPRLCRLWERVEADQPISADAADDYQAMLERLECSLAD